MAHYLVPQVFRILLLQPQSVIFLFFVPVLQTNDQVNILGILDIGYTKQCLYIHDSDTAELYEMLRNIRRGAHQRIIADLPDLHRIIGYQTVAPLNQLQGSLRFPDSAFPCDQDTFPVNIHQNAVNGNTGGQLHIQPPDNLRHKSGGRLFGHQQGNLIFHCNLHKKLIRPKLPAKNKCRYLTGKETCINFSLSLLRERPHISIFHKANDLKSGSLKMFKIAGQLKRGPVNIRLFDLYFG